jgi:hypothetical protein
METEGSLPCSQEPATGLYPEPDEFSVKFSHIISSRSISILYSLLLLDLANSVLPLGFSKKIPVCSNLL